jgi:hypothetical protein
VKSLGKRGSSLVFFHLFQGLFYIEVFRVLRELGNIREIFENKHKEWLGSGRGVFFGLQ